MLLCFVVVCGAVLCSVEAVSFGVFPVASVCVLCLRYGACCCCLVLFCVGVCVLSCVCGVVCVVYCLCWVCSVVLCVVVVSLFVLLC